VREAEWKRREGHNDAEVARWAIEAPDGWGNTPPTSPVQEGWPGVPVDTNRETWPLLSDVVPVRSDGWPDLSPPVSGDTGGISASDWPRPPEWVWVS
jgi:hypothetical protein